MIFEKLAFVLHEDRKLTEAALRVSIASLRKHYPESAIVVGRPNATENFLRWCSELKGGKVHVIATALESASSWNCKPHILLEALKRLDCERVMWVDSDIVLSRRFDESLAGIREEEVLIAQEFQSETGQGSAIRTASWGFRLGRELGFSINSAVVSFSRAHQKLVEEWKERLSDPVYCEWQTKEITDRPLAFRGDQDVLEALLTSEVYSSIPIRLLRSGKEIAHCGGALSYRFSDRLWGIFNPTVPFLHASGLKPWWCLYANHSKGKFSARDFYRHLLQEASPYLMEARKYREAIEIEAEWLSFSTPVGLFVRALGMGKHSLQGWPLAAAATVLEIARLHRKTTWRHA